MAVCQSRLTVGTEIPTISSRPPWSTRLTCDWRRSRILVDHARRFYYRTGNYSVESNGIGLVTYKVSETQNGKMLFTLPIRFVLINDGRELRGFPLPAGFAVICDLKEQ